MTARAGIVVTGTEVLTGRVQDRNGPWLAEQLRERGVDVGRIVVVGDRPDDLSAALASLDDHDLVITTGGLGPTADDLTAELVARHQGHSFQLDTALESRILAIVERLANARGWEVTPALAAGARKQAFVPAGAHVLEPTGTAPGLVVPAEAGPPVLVLPGPPGELRAMWPAAVADPLVATVLGQVDPIQQETLRIWGAPEPELAAALREHEASSSVEGLEVTTCMREGELEVVTRFSPAAEARYADLAGALRSHFGDDLFSTDGRDLDRIVADLLRHAGATVATAESCTAGMLASRLADLSGSSAYLVGGFVTYSNEAKTTEVAVSPELLQRVGAVSEEVARAMAEGARTRLGTTYGLSTTGVAGPDGGTPEKPVGLVHVAVAGPRGIVHRRLRLAGGRSAVRSRAVVSTLHLLREVLTSNA
ncbi:competence/damage-inducible protein A [Nocardioides daejeonensis]|uniref:competence/damage-inducible protein A n=1 Tax=Nocardioides daejeonensis TaxID=1046556 RepID=UPI000D74A609|nr:competence/damage-inducible protein A [Nocardioides daejeonensis]